MHINKELKQIEKVGEIAWNLVQEGNFRGARRVIKKIKNSFCVSESTRLSTIIEARIMQGLGKQQEAKEKVLANLGYVWGIEAGFEIIAASNQKVDDKTSLYYIEVLGGLATLGAFLQFTEQHVASFDVVANSQEEALSYIEEVCHFAEPENRLVITCTQTPLQLGEFLHRGVIRAYPFRIFEAT